MSKSSRASRDEGNLPVTQAQVEDAIQLSGAIFQLLVLLRLHVEIILELLHRDHFGGRILIALSIGLDGEDPQVLARNIETWNSPSLESVIVVPSDEIGAQLLPSFINCRPR